MGEPALVLEVVVAPIEKLGDGVGGEEIGPAAAAGEFPQRRLGAILAKLEGVMGSGLRPRAGNAHEAARLVLARKRLERRRRRPFMAKNAGDSSQRTPAARGAVVMDHFARGPGLACGPVEGCTVRRVRHVDASIGLK